MASALKCDRCGKLFEPRSFFGYKILKRRYIIAFHYTDRVLDLCPCCYNQLRDWMENPYIREEEK